MEHFLFMTFDWNELDEQHIYLVPAESKERAIEIFQEIFPKLDVEWFDIYAASEKINFLINKMECT